ncbi:MAG: extracellular solute-binding protein [bacterium]|nr:extracellular solute-binding protein [bacterium]
MKLIVGAALSWATAQSRAPAAAPPGPTVIDEIHFASENVNYKPAFEEIIRRYERIHPEIRVKLTVVPQNMETWIRTKFAGGLAMAPDIYNGEQTPTYGKQGKWVSLNSYLEQVNPYTGRPWAETMDMTLLRHYDISGQIYAIALDTIDIGIVYNQEIFDRLGLKPPRTWEELLGQCETIQRAGYVPFALPGDFHDFYIGVTAWLVRFFSDAYCRDLVPLFMAQPGDWDYTPEDNGNFKLDLTDRFNDAEVVIDVERQLMAFRDGRFRFDSDRFRALYRQLKRFSRYWEPGWAGTDMGMANQLFLKQRAAMMFESSGVVVALDFNMRDLRPEDRFRWGVMTIPPITRDPYCLAPFRGVGGAGTYYVITDKRSIDPAHVERVVDFMRFLASPSMGEVLVRETLANDWPIAGPLAIKGVKLPGDLAAKYEPFIGRGYEKVTFVGLGNEQESIFDWATLAQEFFAGRIDEDTFLRQYQAAMERALPRIVSQLNLDWNPATRDEVGFRTPPPRNPFNPIENGGLMVLLLLAGLAVFAAVSHALSRRRYGAHYAPLTFVLLLPTFALLATFNYFPVISGLCHAFTHWEEGVQATFNGLDNFRRMARDIYLFTGLGNLAILIAAGLFKSTVVPFLVAELIMSLRGGHWRSFYRTAFLVPMVAPGIVMILIWKFIYDPNLGLLNGLLERVERALGTTGLQHVWLGDPDTALGSIVMMGFPWVGALGLLIYMAGLQQIGPSIYEAYRMDGASVWKRLWHIDIPLVGGQTRLLVILTMIGVLQDFFSVLLLTDGGPGMATMLPALRMYHVAFRFSHFGYGAAIGFVLFVGILTVTLLNLRLWRRETALE